MTESEIELERAKLEFERQKWATQSDHDSKQLQISERQVELDDKFRNLSAQQAKAESLAKFWGVAITVIVALLGGIATVVGGILQAQSQTALEADKNKSQLILKAIDPSNTDQSVKNLQFLTDVGLLDDKDGKILQAAKKNAPTVTTNGSAPPSKQGSGSSPLHGLQAASDVLYVGAMECDTDGKREAGIKYDPDHQDMTGLDPSGSAVDSNQIPYVVWPAGSPGGPSLGDYVTVVYRGHTSYAIMADFGPRTRFGEGSIALLRSLGLEEISNGQVQGIALNRDVIYVPHTGTRDKSIPTPEGIKARGAQIFDQWGGMKRLRTELQKVGFSEALNGPPESTPGSTSIRTPSAQ
ncbi:MAG: glycoside hydrolase family 75 protein [Fimbriimonas sp.]|nr:glycoside hydrolase family 75 protein [Fimbriimonas sp.]